MFDIRVFYQKTGRAKYISHLDVMRCMQRALKRAKLPVWHTEGFNPHVYLTFALPLSLGYESVYEVMDFRLTDEIPYDEVKERLNRHLPEGISVTKVAAPVKKAKEIKSALYEIMLYSDKPDNLAENITACLESAEIFAEKRNKKKQLLTVDIKPMVISYKLEKIQGGVCLLIVLAAGTGQSINPAQLLFAVEEQEIIESFEVKRMEVYDEEGNLFK